MDEWIWMMSSGVSGSEHSDVDGGDAMMRWALVLGRPGDHANVKVTACIEGPEYAVLFNIPIG